MALTCTAALFCRRQELIPYTPHTNLHKIPQQWASHSREPGTSSVQNQCINSTIRNYEADNDVTTTMNLKPVNSNIDLDIRNPL